MTGANQTAGRGRGQRYPPDFRAESLNADLAVRAPFGSKLAATLSPARFKYQRRIYE